MQLPAETLSLVSQELTRLSMQLYMVTWLSLLVVCSVVRPILRPVLGARIESSENDQVPKSLDTEAPLNLVPRRGGGSPEGTPSPISLEEGQGESPVTSDVPSAAAMSQGEGNLGLPLSDAKGGGGKSPEGTLSPIPQKGESPQALDATSDVVMSQGGEAQNSEGSLPADLEGVERSSANSPSPVVLPGGQGDSSQALAVTSDAALVSQGKETTEHPEDTAVPGSVEGGANKPASKKRCTLTMSFKNEWGESVSAVCSYDFDLQNSTLPQPGSKSNTLPQQGSKSNTDQRQCSLPRGNILPGTSETPYSPVGKSGRRELVKLTVVSLSAAAQKRIAGTPGQKMAFEQKIKRWLSKTERISSNGWLLLYPPERNVVCKVGSVAVRCFTSDAVDQRSSKEHILQGLACSAFQLNKNEDLCVALYKTEDPRSVSVSLDSVLKNLRLFVKTLQGFAQDAGNSLEVHNCKSLIYSLSSEIKLVEQEYEEHRTTLEDYQSKVQKEGGASLREQEELVQRSLGLVQSEVYQGLEKIKLRCLYEWNSQLQIWLEGVYPQAKTAIKTTTESGKTFKESYEQPFVRLVSAAQVFADWASGCLCIRPVKESFTRQPNMLPIKESFSVNAEPGKAAGCSVTPLSPWLLQVKHKNVDPFDLQVNFSESLKTVQTRCRGLNADRILPFLKGLNVSRYLYAFTRKKTDTITIEIQEIASGQANLCQKMSQCLFKTPNKLQAIDPRQEQVSFVDVKSYILEHIRYIKTKMNSHGHSGGYTVLVLSGFSEYMKDLETQYQAEYKGLQTAIQKPKTGDADWKTLIFAPLSHQPTSMDLVALEQYYKQHILFALFLISDSILHNATVNYKDNISFFECLRDIMNNHNNKTGKNFIFKKSAKKDMAKVLGVLYYLREWSVGGALQQEGDF